MQILDSVKIGKCMHQRHVKLLPELENNKKNRWSAIALWMIKSEKYLPRYWERILSPHAVGNGSPSREYIFSLSFSRNVFPSLKIDSRCEIDRWTFEALLEFHRLSLSLLVRLRTSSAYISIRGKRMRVPNNVHRSKTLSLWIANPKAIFARNSFTSTSFSQRQSRNFPP